MSDDNPPAFPTERSEYNYDAKLGHPTVTRRSEDGMTLRDYFAAAALTGMMADRSTSAGNSDYASVAYGLADAMLAERSKP